MRRRLATVVITVGVLGASLAVGAGSPAGANAGPVLPPPSSMAAAGDSYTKGFANGGPGCTTFGPLCPQNSWATGTAVNSHYQRLVALNPALAANATNAAQLGAPISGLFSQMDAVDDLQPDYVTVLLGGGNVCGAPVTPADFAVSFRAGMDKLFATSPDSHVLVASIWNFESLRSAVLTGNPSATWFFCQVFFNASATDRATIMARVVAYNAVLATECATYTNCLYDGDALYNHAWLPGEVSTIDNVHPSVAGEEMISQVLFDAGYTWAAQPPNADACKQGAWDQYVDATGAAFTNQGDCVSFVATAGRNAAAG